MTFQQQIAVYLTLTVTSDNRIESFVLLPLSWLLLFLWKLFTLPTRAVSRLELALVQLDKWLTVYPFGGRQTIWGIG